MDDALAHRCAAHLDPPPVPMSQSEAYEAGYAAAQRDTLQIEDVFAACVAAYGTTPSKALNIHQKVDPGRNAATVSISVPKEASPFCYVEGTGENIAAALKALHEAAMGAVYKKRDQAECEASRMREVAARLNREKPKAPTVEAPQEDQTKIGSTRVEPLPPNSVVELTTDRWQLGDDTCLIKTGSEHYYYVHPSGKLFGGSQNVYGAQLVGSVNRRSGENRATGVIEVGYSFSFSYDGQLFFTSTVRAIEKP
jgi:hypothetical protein